MNDLTLIEVAYLGVVSRRGEGLYLVKQPPLRRVSRATNANPNDSSSCHDCMECCGTPSPEEAEYLTARDAFMNKPHPLETLADARSYGTNGTISRDHDPNSYIRAVECVLARAQREREESWMGRVRIPEMYDYIN